MYKDVSLDVSQDLEEKMLKIVENSKDKQKPWDIVEKLVEENDNITKKEARKVLKKITLDRRIRFSSKGYIKINKNRNI